MHWGIWIRLSNFLGICPKSGVALLEDNAFEKMRISSYIPSTQEALEILKAFDHIHFM